MASLVLKMSISLDGFVAASDGSSGWEAEGRSPDGAAWVLETISGASAHLMGSTTYERFATYWPSAPGPIAQAMNDIPKYVFSSSLTSADWAGTTIVTGDLTDEVTRLKQEQSGGYVLAQGGVRFARSLVASGLVDEYRLVVHPVLLGSGEPLFTTPLTIDLISTTPFSAGAVAHVFTARA